MSWFNRKPSETPEPTVEVREVSVPSDGEIVYGFFVSRWNGFMRTGIGFTIDPAEALSAAGDSGNAVLVRLYHLPDGTYVRGQVLERVTLGLTKPEAKS